MKKRKFVIVGGGTAGWITAHAIRKYFPDDDVSIIYSEIKGTIGVGEATTPHMTEFLNNIGIDLRHFLKTVGGTIKHGISFENWNGDGRNYLHPFAEKLANFSIPNVFSNDCWDLYNKLLINKNLPFDQYLYQTRLAAENKIDINNTLFAVHFDSFKFAEYLKWFSSVKNIKSIIGDVISTDLTDDGNIKTINLEDVSIDCDFVFDCSGFSKLLIGKLYKEEWISYKKYLPMDRAISFWTDHEGDKIPSYTAAIAMKYGWIWKIPLQNRFGCGYVYDSAYIDEHQAQQEAEELFQQKLNVRKVINIDAGRYKNVWVKNCIAVGLSGNFIEPLESTSIWLELALLENLKHFLKLITVDKHYYFQ
jgi:tryptophan halogenase